MLRENPHLSLMGALGFTAADLSDNRHGKLSHRQREQLHKRQLNLIRNALIALTALGVMVVVLGGKWLVFLFGIVIIASFLVLNWIRLGTDLRGQVELASGCLRYAPAFPFGVYLMIGQERFAISRRLSDVFADDHCYHVYYVPSSRTILSAEML